MDRVGRKQLLWQPDCLSQLPQNEVLVGCYELESGEEQIKTGGFVVISQDGNEAYYRLNTGILDCKITGNDRVITCCSDGSVRIHGLGSMQETGSFPVFSQSTTYISVLNQICSVTSSGGNLALCDLETMEILRSVRINEYESWFTEVTSSGIYASAGTSICVFSTVSDDLMRINTEHDSEICSFSVQDFTLTTGDYSGNLHKMDLRTRKCLSKVKLCDSGIWRFTECGDWSVAACMQSGLIVWSLEETYRDESQSLVYGVLVQWPQVYSCSFYERTVTQHKVG